MQIGDEKKRTRELVVHLQSLTGEFSEGKQEVYGTYSLISQGEPYLPQSSFVHVQVEGEGLTH
jgi:hypothetical protein